MLDEYCGDIGNVLEHRFVPRCMSDSLDEGAHYPPLREQNDVGLLCSAAIMVELQKGAHLIL